MLLYDRETESLWSQLLRSSVTGPLTGKKLPTIPSVLVTWGKWRELHPETLVLSVKTGFSRDYSRDPYRSYYKNPFAFFDFPMIKKGIKAKELVYGVEVGGGKKAYPLRLLKALTGQLHDTVAGVEITITRDSESGAIRLGGEGGEGMAGLITYWFVWNSFHPDTGVYTAREKPVADSAP